MVQGPARKRFWDELEALYQAAGGQEKQTLKQLVRLGRDQKPPITISDSTINDWLTRKTVPMQREKVRYFEALVKKLLVRAAQCSGYEVKPWPWWEDQLKAAQDEARQAQRRGRPSAPKVPDITPPGAQQDRDPAPVTPWELDDYLRRMTVYVAAGLPTMVPLTISMESGETFDSSQLVKRIREGQHLHLVGPSGSGKTHLLRHTALGLVQRGWFPVFVRAGLYDKDGLEALLDGDSVPAHSARKALELIRGARELDRPVVLLVDGLNECPAGLQDRLLREVSALCLREASTVVTTGQQRFASLELLSGMVLGMGVLSIEQRTSILRAYGADPEDSTYTPFATPQELSLAAELAGHLPSGAGRGLLLDEYIRKRLSSTEHPSGVRDVLRQWALAMDRQLSGALLEGEAERIALKVAPLAFTEAKACPLVMVARQRITFVHELYHRLLAAEGLVLQHADDSAGLVQELSAPRHTDLVELALPLIDDVDTVQRIMADLPNGERIGQALRGRFGTTVGDVADTEARRLLADANRIMAGAAVHFDEGYRTTLSPGVSWGAYEKAVFEAIGGLVPSGRFFSEIVVLFTSTDAAFQRATREEPRPDEETLPFLIGCALASLRQSGSDWLPAAAIIRACDLYMPSKQDGVPLDELARLAASVGSQTYSVAYLVCLLLRWAGGPDVIGAAPSVARIAWDSGAYHLRLEVLNMLTYVRRRADDGTYQELAAFLGELHSDHMGLSSAIAEVMSRYGLVEPIEKAQEVASRIHALLADESHPWAPAFAYGIFSSQFEEITSDPHFEAIQGLDSGARNRLLALAARHTETASSSTGLILAELMAAEKDVALPAFVLWAGRLEQTNWMSFQEVVACYLLGIVGCAQHGHALPPLEGHEGPAGDAWRCYGRILWCLHNPGLSDEEINQQCETLWQRLIRELPDAAADPLFWMDIVDGESARAVFQRLVDRFPDRMRTVLEYGIFHADWRIHFGGHSLFHIGELPFEAYFKFRDRDVGFIRMLASIGNDDTARRLTALADDPELGRDAVETVRRLKRLETGEDGGSFVVRPDQRQHP